MDKRKKIGKVNEKRKKKKVKKEQKMRKLMDKGENREKAVPRAQACHHTLNNGSPMSGSMHVQLQDIND